MKINNNLRTLAISLLAASFLAACGGGGGSGGGTNGGGAGTPSALYYAPMTGVGAAGNYTMTTTRTTNITQNGITRQNVALPATQALFCSDAAVHTAVTQTIGFMGTLNITSCTFSGLTGQVGMMIDLGIGQGYTTAATVTISYAAGPVNPVNPVNPVVPVVPPIVITAMPYTGVTGNKHFTYTTVGAANQLSSTLTWNQAYFEIYTDATFTVLSPNWSCQSGVSCTAITPVAAGTTLFINEFVGLPAPGGAPIPAVTYTLNVLNVVVVPSQGAALSPVAIALPYGGAVGTTADSFYSYVTTAATNKITASLLTADIDPQVYLDAGFTLRNFNWVCTANVGVTNDTCTSSVPVAAGTILYIRASNFTAGMGANFSLSAANVAPLSSLQGAALAPVAIALPYNGLVGASGLDSFYKITTTAPSTALITAALLTADIDPVVYSDAAFTIINTNWFCTVNGGTLNDTCTATVPVAAGTVLYMKIVNFARVSSTFMLQ